MNRRDRRALAVEQHTFIKEKKLPDTLTLLPAEDCPKQTTAHDPVLIFQSKKYLVQVYEEYTYQYPELKRLSICRVTLNGGGRWHDGLTWDELQDIKRQCGYGDWYGLEIFPPDHDIVNVANMRHLWIMPTPFGIGWTK